MPCSDFEDQVMFQIEKKELQQQVLLKNVKLSWIFFVIGSLFGLLLSVMVPQLLPTIPGIDTMYITLFVQALIIVIVALNLDSLIRFTREKIFRNIPE